MLVQRQILLIIQKISWDKEDDGLIVIFHLFNILLGTWFASKYVERNWSEHIKESMHRGCM